MRTVVKNVRNEGVWPSLKEIRKEIFVIEQGLESCLIEDDFDDTCTHIIVYDDTKIVGSCRVRSDEDTAYIERLVVAKSYRNQSLGKQMIHQAIKVAYESQIVTLVILAQSHLSDMYQKYGFVEDGEAFDFYGASHTRMIKNT